MRYTDNGGDVWEDVADGYVRVIRMGGRDVTYAEPCEIEHAERQWGPLRPIVDDDEAPDALSDSLPRVTDVMDRAAVFQSAHALVTGLEWGEEKASVYDVLQVAKWLEGEG